MKLSDFLSFDKMVTPFIIQAIFWIGVTFSVLSGLIMVGRGIGSVFRGGGTAILAILVGLLWIVLGPLMTRVYCELLMVVFKIHDHLNDIKNSLHNNPPSPSGPPGLPENS